MVRFAGHDKSVVWAAEIPALAENARTGPPEFRNGKGERQKARLHRREIRRRTPPFALLRVGGTDECVRSYTNAGCRAFTNAARR